MNIALWLSRNGLSHRDMPAVATGTRVVATYGEKDPAGNAVGNHVKVKIVKNKVAPPFAEAEFDILYNHGINKEGSILEVGIDAGVVDKKGAWLQFEGELIGQGKEAAQKALVEKPELADKIVQAIMAKRNAQPVAAAA